MRFGELLEMIRQDRGMTQIELAERVKLSNGYISKLERGESNPKYNTIRKLGKALNFEIIIEW